MLNPILLVEGCDFDSFPTGGQLTFVRHLLLAFPGRFALVGVATDDSPIGCWTVKEVDGVSYPFFAVGKRSKTARRPPLPARLSFYVQLLFHTRGIQSLGARFAFALAPEAIMVIARWKWESLAYEFSGIENPLSAPRYRWARPFASLFDKVHLRAARQANNLFAAADQQAIAQLVTRSQGILANREIVQSPTSFDSNCFKPVPKDAARRLLGLDVNVPILIASGRISSVKGWDFLLDAFDRFKITHGNALMIFVGDGEDRLQLERQVQTRQLTKSVRITGFESPERVALYINAGDVALLGSRREGWPTAIVEALACGRPVVSTHVSGASTLILNGLNGQVVEGRDPTSFARAISSVLDMPDAAAVSLEVASRYTLGAFGSRLAEHWGPLRSTSEQLSRESRFGCPQESLVPHV